MGGVTVFELGLRLPWHKPSLAKAVRTVYLRNAVFLFSQYNRLGGRTASYPNIIQSLADRLSCLSLGAPLRSFLKHGTVRAVHRRRAPCALPPGAETRAPYTPRACRENTQTERRQDAHVLRLETLILQFSCERLGHCCGLHCRDDEQDWLFILCYLGCRGTQKSCQVQLHRNRRVLYAALWNTRVLCCFMPLQLLRCPADDASIALSKYSGWGRARRRARDSVGGAGGSCNGSMICVCACVFWKERSNFCHSLTLACFGVKYGCEGLDTSSQVRTRSREKTSSAALFAAHAVSICCMLSPPAPCASVVSLSLSPDFEMQFYWLHNTQHRVRSRFNHISSRAQLQI